jgi:N-acetylmuramoyl-L-alanine amidase
MRGHNMSAPHVSSRAVLAHAPEAKRTRVASWLSIKPWRGTNHNRAARVGIIGFNAIVLVAVLALVAVNIRAGVANKPVVASEITLATNQAISNPLDQLSSADIAVNVARLANMPEKTAVTNQADTANAELHLAAATESTIVAKPQVVNTVFKSKKDIKVYVTAAGDTVSGVAAKFGIRSDSVRWSNNLVGDTVAAGSRLAIPPVDGIVYSVKAGDTPESLAAKYSANKESIIAYNDAELVGLRVGEQIIIPNGQLPVPVVAAPRYSYGFAFGSSPIYGYNGYDYGFCTWYVANRIAVPSNWGNANTWDTLAPSSGWVVSSVPRPGAIGQTNRGREGHVAVVEAVSPDGSMIKYSDMNGLAGWGRVGYSDWVPVSKYENYIFR